MPYIRPNRGFGDYEPSAFNVEWPYQKNKGMGCAGGCGCGGTCGDDHGMGLFDSADPTTWGVGEYGVLGIGGYLAYKLVEDAKTVGKAVGKRAKRATRKSKSAVSGGLGSLGSIALLGGLGYGAYLLWSKSQASTAGLSDYQAQKYVRPQILVAPVQSAAIRIPAGW